MVIILSRRPETSNYCSTLLSSPTASADCSPIFDEVHLEFGRQKATTVQTHEVH